MQYTALRKGMSHMHSKAGKSQAKGVIPSHVNVNVYVSGIGRSGVWGVFGSLFSMWFEERIVAYFFGTLRRSICNKKCVFYFVVWKIRTLANSQQPAANSKTMASTWQAPKYHAHTHTRIHRACFIECLCICARGQQHSLWLLDGLAIKRRFVCFLFFFRWSRNENVCVCGRRAKRNSKSANNWAMAVTAACCQLVCQSASDCQHCVWVICRHQLGMCANASR